MTKKVEWLSVKDWLSATDGECLICIITTGYYNEKENHFYANLSQPNSVSHWAELPEPPECG